MTQIGRFAAFDVGVFAAPGGARVTRHLKQARELEASGGNPVILCAQL